MLQLGSVLGIQFEAEDFWGKHLQMSMYGPGRCERKQLSS